MSSNPGMRSDGAVFGEICSCSKSIKVSVFQCGSRAERSTRPTIQWMSASKCVSFCAAREGSSRVSGSDGSYLWDPKWSTVFAISETLRPQLCDYDCDYFHSDLACKPLGHRYMNSMVRVQVKETQNPDEATQLVHHTTTVHPDGGSATSLTRCT